MCHSAWGREIGIETRERPGQRQTKTEGGRSPEAKGVRKPEAVTWGSVRRHIYGIYIFKGPPVYEDLCTCLAALVNVQ